MEVIVVDNASSDLTLTVVKRDFPEVQVIQNAINSGYAGACNRGILAARGDFVMIMNDDLFLAPDALRFLTQSLFADETLAAVGPLIWTGESEGISVQQGGPLEVYWLFRGFLDIRVRVSTNPVPSLKHAAVPMHEDDVDHLYGACILFRRSLLRKVGLFDENYWMQFEDLDLCWRMRREGYRLGFVPAARAEHIHGRARNSNRNSVLLSIMHTKKNYFYFARKHFELLRFIVFCIAKGPTEGLHLAYYFLHDWGKFGASLRALGWALKHIPNLKPVEPQIDT